MGTDEPPYEPGPREERAKHKEIVRLVGKDASEHDCETDERRGSGGVCPDRERREQYGEQSDLRFLHLGERAERDQRCHDDRGDGDRSAPTHGEGERGGQPEQHERRRRPADVRDQDLQLHEEGKHRCEQRIPDRGLLEVERPLHGSTVVDRRAGVTLRPADPGYPTRQSERHPGRRTTGAGERRIVGGMNTQRFLTYAALAGGLVWLGKLAVLAATDGAESALVGTLYFSGLCLLALGSIGIALKLLECRPRWLRVSGAVLAPFAFLIIFLFLDGVLVPPTRDHVPNRAEVEAGVFTAAVIWLAAGTWALRPGPKGRTQLAR